MKTALITGISGQDGSYLAELLLSKGYRVYGISRYNAGPNAATGLPITGRLSYLHGDISSKAFIFDNIQKVRPDEVYNLAGQSNKVHSFAAPLETAEVNGFSVAYMLEALRKEKPDARFFQASSALVIEPDGAAPTSTRFDSPYTTAKVFAQLSAQLYRVHYGMYAVCGILYNHESERRKPDFLSRKISSTVAKIAIGEESCIYLGNMDAARDWCHAGDVVRAMWAMLQAEKPEDAVIASGETHTVREFVQLAFESIGVQLRFEGSGLEETGLDAASGEVRVRVAKEFYRQEHPSAVARGDPSALRESTGWRPQVSFEELVRRMVKADLSAVKNTYVEATHEDV